MMTYIFNISAVLALLVASASASAVSDSSDLAYLMYTDSGWQVYLMTSDTSKSHILTELDFDVSTVSWLGDDKHLFVCGIQGNAAIYNITNGKNRPINLPFKNINDAVISPDGRLLAFSHIAPGTINNKLWLLNLDNNVVTPVMTEIRGMQYDPEWSTDGKALYFVSGEAGQAYGISSYTLADKKYKRVIEDEFHNLDADISVNGHIAYSSNRAGNFDIWIDTGQERTRVTVDAGTQSHPDWSPDGKTIYYESVRDGVSNIWSITLSDDSRSHARKQLTFSKSGARYPAASRGIGQ